MTEKRGFIVMGLHLTTAYAQERCEMIVDVLALHAKFVIGVRTFLGL